MFYNLYYKILISNFNIIGGKNKLILASGGSLFLTGFFNFNKFYSTKSILIDSKFLKIKKFLKKEEKAMQWHTLKFKEEIKFSLIHLGNLNFDLIIYKIKLSKVKMEEIENNKKFKEKIIDFDFFIVKKSNKKTEYIINYINFLKNYNILNLLFIVLIEKVVEISIIYIWEGKILNYYIFYEIYIQDFFSFMNRVLDEIKIFELYLYDKNCIIPKAIIKSININIIQKFYDKSSIKYI